MADATKAISIDDVYGATPVPQAAPAKQTLSLDDVYGAEPAKPAPALPQQPQPAPTAPEKPGVMSRLADLYRRYGSPEAQLAATEQLVTGLPRATAGSLHGVGGLEQLAGELMERHPTLSGIVAPGVNPADLTAAGKATQAYYGSVASGRPINTETLRPEGPGQFEALAPPKETGLASVGRFGGDVGGQLINLAAGGGALQGLGASGALANATLAGGFGAQAAGSQYGEARAQGATPEQAQKAAAISGAVNTALGFVPGMNTEGSIARQVAVRGARGVGLGTAAGIGQNLAAREYNPNQGILEGLPENIANFVAFEGAHGAMGLIGPRRGYQAPEPMADPKVARIADNAEQQLVAAGVDPTQARQQAQAHAVEIADKAQQKGLDPLELERQSPLTTQDANGNPIDVEPTDRRNQSPRAQQIRNLVGKRNTQGLQPDEAQKLSDLLEEDRNQAKVGPRDLPGVLSKAAYQDLHAQGQLKPIQVYSDLDNFKRINDTFGHSTGDQAILAYGKALNKHFGQGNVFHMGGDEFVAHADTPEQADQLMQKVRDDMANFQVKGEVAGKDQTHKGIGLSYGKGGISDAVDEDGNPIPYRDAEIAQYEDKQARKQAGLRFERDEAPSLLPEGQQPEQPVSPRLTKFRYKDETGQNVEVPVESPEHRNELADILDQHDQWTKEIKQIPGDDEQAKALRHRLYEQVGNDRARALKDLHTKIEMDKAGGPPPEEPQNMDADTQSPEGQKAVEELGAPTKKLLDTIQTDVSPEQDVGMQDENRRRQTEAAKALMVPIARQLSRLSAADQRAIYDNIESKGKTPLAPWLEKYRDGIFLPILDKIGQYHVEAGEVSGNPSKIINDPDVNWVFRHWVEEKNPPTLAKRLARWLNFQDPTAEAGAEFQTQKGLPTGDTIQKHREYYALKDAEGKRTVVHVSNAGKLAVAGEGDEATNFRRKNTQKYIQRQLEGPLNRADRATERAQDTFDSLLGKKPEALEKQADILAAKSGVLGDTIKKLARVSGLNESGLTKNLLDKHAELLDAQLRGDHDYAARRDEGIRIAAKDFDQAVEDHLNAPLERVEAKIKDLNAKIKGSKRASDIQRWEDQLGDLYEQHQQLEDEAGSANHDEVAESNPRLKRMKLDLEDKVNKFYDKQLNTTEAQIKAVASRVNRNQALSDQLEAKAREYEGRSVQRNEEAQRMRERFDHLQPEEAMRALAAEEKPVPGSDREPRMTAALKKLDEARQELANKQREMGAIKPEDRIYTGPDGKVYTLGQAKAGEIEAATGKKLDPYFGMNLLYHMDRMSQVARNLKVLKNNWEPAGHPRFDENGNELPAPQGFAPTTLTAGGLNKYYFPKEVARALDHLQYDMKRSENTDSMYRAAQNIVSLMGRSIFYNPLIHIGNTSLHYAVDRGWRNLNPEQLLGGAFKDNLEAYKEIVNMDPKFLDAVNHGLRAMTFIEKGNDFRNALDQRLHDQISKLSENDPKVVKLARAMGVPPAEFIKSFYRNAGDALWLMDDVMRYEAYNHYREIHPDWSKEDVVKRVNEGIASYTANRKLPVSVRSFIENPLAFIFSRYHQFQVGELFHRLKDTVAPSERVSASGKTLQAKGEVWSENIGKMATLASIMVALRPAINAILQKVYKMATGKDREDLKLRMLGPTTLPSNIISGVAGTETGQKMLESIPSSVRDKLYEGPKTPFEVAQSVLTPSPLAPQISKAMFGRDTYTGRRLTPAEVAGQAIQGLAPVGQAVQLAGGRLTPGNFLLSQLGVGVKGSPAMVAAKKAVADTYSTGAMTDEDKASMQAKGALKVQAQGAPPSQGGAMSPEQQKMIEGAVKEGNITKAQATKIVKEANLPPEKQLAIEVEKLRGSGAPDAAMSVWRLATPEERRAIQPQVAKILSRTQNKTEAQTSKIQALRAEFSRDVRNHGAQ